MSKYLIVNADDYGLCPEISIGIIDAYQKGIVTSTSVVPNGRHFQEGLEPLKQSRIATGIHLTFVGGEKPLTRPIDGLVDDRGHFLHDYTRLIPRIITNRYDRDGLRKELLAQVTRLLDAGLTISHLDAHQHLHLLPGIRSILLHMTTRFNIKWIRIPRSHRWTIPGICLNMLGLWLKNRLRRKQFRYADECLGFDHSGHINETILSEMINRCRPGVTEIILHPGLDASEDYDWNFEWTQELAAAMSPKIKALVRQNQIILTTYRDLL